MNPNKKVKYINEDVVQEVRSSGSNDDSLLEAAMADAVIAGAVMADAVMADAVMVDAVNAGAVMADAVMVDAVMVDAVNAGAVMADAVIVDAVNAGAVMADAVMVDAVNDDAVSADTVMADEVIGHAVMADEVMADAVETGDEGQLRRLCNSDSTNLVPLVRLACRFCKLQVLDLLITGIAVNTSSINEDQATACLNSVDAEGHNALYYAIRSGSVQLLITLLELWPRLHLPPEALDPLLAASYGQLKLMHVPLTEEMESYIQYKLLDLRFFYEDSKLSTHPVVKLKKTKQDELKDLHEKMFLIQQRIKILVANINILIKYQGKMVDEVFIHRAKFIALNIHIIKQLAKCTYDEVPWEEMEFCLLCFMAGHTERREINICYLSVLKRDRLLRQLEDFAGTIRTIDLTKLGQRVRSNRDTVVQHISEKYPDLKSLYDDYKHVRDMTSLDIMQRYIDAALLADPAARRGQLTIKRALQVAGEYLKNTLDSPNLSTATGELLLLSAPKETRKVLQTLRNSLSHLLPAEKNVVVVQEGSSSGSKEDLQKGLITDDNGKLGQLCPTSSTDTGKLYCNMQNDIKKIGNVITYLMFMNKNNILKKFILAEIVKCKNVDEIQNYLQIFENLSWSDMQKWIKINDIIITEDQQIEDLIDTIDMQIKDQTPSEEQILFEIRELLHEHSFDLKSNREEYIDIMSELKNISIDSFVTESEMKQFMFHFIDKYDLDSKYPIDETTKDSHKGNLSLENKQDHFLDLLRQFSESVQLRICPEVGESLIYIVSKIAVITWCNKGYINWIDGFREKLSPQEAPSQEMSKRQQKKSIQQPTKPSRDTLDKQLKVLLAELGVIIESSQKEGRLPKKDASIRPAMETLMLDIMSLVDDDCLPHNFLYLEDNMPLMIGRSLRNYLAHGNALVDSVLLSDSLCAILLNAVKLAELETRYNLVLKKRKMGLISSNPDIKQFEQKFKKGLQIIINCEDMYNALIKGSVDSAKLCLRNGTDLNARNRLDQSTTLHCAAQGGNLDLVRFVIEQGVSSGVLDINGRSPLHVAAEFGHILVVKFLVEEMASPVDLPDDNGKTPLHLAVSQAHEQTVLALLSLGAKTFTKDHSYQSPLHYAVRSNFLQLVKVLIEKDETVDSNRSSSGYTSLHTAAECGYRDLVQYLLDNRADPNAKSFLGERPLHLAAHNGHLDTVKALLDKGAYVNLRNSKGRTPLYNAVKAMHPKVVQILLDSEAFIEIGDKEDCRTPLQAAALNGDKEIVTLLLERGANVNAASEGDCCRTPLLYAAHEDDEELIDLLLMNDATLDCTDSHGLTPLHFSAMRGNNATVKSLLKHNANIEAISDEHSMTPLHMAANEGNRDTVDILISAGANVHSTTAVGNTPLHLSAGRGNLSVIESLIFQKANINAKNMTNSTPLHEAVVKSFNEETVKLLLKSPDIDVDAQDATKATPLHKAAFYGNLEIVKVLIQQAAEINAQDEDGKTPLYMAVWGNHLAVVKLLLDYKANVNLLTKDGYSALCCAVRTNNKLILDILIAKGANVNEKGGEPLLIAILTGYSQAVDSLLRSKDIDVFVEYDGRSTLRAAAESGNRRIGKALIDKQVPINVIAHNSTPLLAAVTRGHKEFVDVLLENGADVDFAPTGIVSPLHCAVAKNYPEIVESLLRKNARTDVTSRINNHTPLESAVAEGKIKIVKILYQHEKKRDPKVCKQSMNNKLLHLAVKGGSLEVVKYLVEKGVDIHGTDNNLGIKAIHLAALKGDADLVEFFLDCGMGIGEVGGEIGMTLLQFAAVSEQVALAQLLLDKQADVDAADNNGTTPLHLVAHSGSKELMELFLSYGAIYDSPNINSETPSDLAQSTEVKEILAQIEHLFKAVSENNVMSVEFLAEQNLRSLNAKRADKLSLLHLASLNGFESICHILLRYKANPNTVGTDGYAPLHYASIHSHYGITLSLLTHGAIYDKQTANGKTPCDYAVDEKICHLLGLIDTTFRKVGNCDLEVFHDLTQIKDDAIVRAVLKAHNSGGNTLVEVAAKCAFPKVDKLLQILQGNLPLTISMVDMMMKKQNYTQALSTLNGLLLERIEVLGEDDLGSLDIRYLIGLVFLEQSKYTEASQLFTEVYRKQEKTLGPCNPRSLKTRSDIALILHCLKKHQEAWDIFKEVIPKQLKFVHEDFAHFLKTISNATIALKALGKNEKALDLYYLIKKLLIEVSDKNDPMALFIDNNIATVLNDLGRTSESLTLFQSNYELSLKILGPQHSTTLLAQLGIASCREEQGTVDEAITACREVLAVQESLPGSCNLKILKLQYVLAVFLLRQDRCDEALATYKRALAQGNTNFGDHHQEIDSLVPLIENFESVLFQRFDISSSRLLSEIDYDIIMAVSTEDISVVEDLIRNGSDVNTADKEGMTPLHLAAKRGSRDIVNLLLKSGANATALSVSGDTSLHTAAASSAPAGIVRALLLNVRAINTNAYDSFINAQNEEGASALHVAAKSGCIDTVMCLLQSGAIYNSLEKANLHTPLQETLNGEVISILELVKKLFACAERGDVARLRGEDPGQLSLLLSCCDMQLRTPMQVAQFFHQTGVVEFLSDILQTRRLDVAML